MPLHDYNLANQTPASYRTDHNNLNLAIAGCNASSSGITTTFSHLLYADVSSSGWMRQRNAADSTFNYLYLLGAAGGLATYAGNPSTNHAAKFQGQQLYDTSNNLVYYATLAGTSSQATWSSIASSSAYSNTAFPKSYIHGLTPLYATAATFTVSAGGCRDSGDAANIAISTAYTVDITVSGAGGLSTSETESTSGAWYFCFAIRKSGDGTVNFILTASSSGAVLPTGYDQTRLLPFAIRNTTQADFLPWVVGEGWPTKPLILWAVSLPNVSATVGPTNVLDGGTASTATTVSCASYQPTISRLVQVKWGKTSASTAAVACHLYGTGTAGANFIYSGFNRSPDDPEDIVAIPTNSSQQIQYAHNSAGPISDIAVSGYYVTEL